MSPLARLLSVASLLLTLGGAALAQEPPPRRPRPEGLAPLEDDPALDPEAPPPGELRVRAESYEQVKPGHVEARGFVDLRLGAMRIQADQADVIETDIVALAHKVVEMKSVSGEETRAMLTELYDSTVKAVELAVRSIRDNDQRAAESVMMLKGAFREQSERLLGRKAARLSAGDPDYLALVRLQMGFVDQMRRIYTLAKRIAKVALPPALAQRD